MPNRNSVHQHLEILKMKHLEIETILREEEKRPAPDPVHIRRLKRKKLDIKDEMAALSQDSQNTIH